MLPLIGHTPLRAKFSAALARGTLPSSLLLHGPAGAGKERLALWLATRILCDTPTAQAEACGVCENCRFAATGAHPDLHWYFPRPKLKDADPDPEDVIADMNEAIADRVASKDVWEQPAPTDNLYVSTTRAIVRRSVYTPAMAKRKVIIVADADRMVSQEGSDQAANAFLKILEEPPPDTTVILTSSLPGALLPTIRSRAVSVRVAPLTADATRELASHQESARASVSAANNAAAAFLKAAQGDDAARYRMAFVQGASKARGAFSETLDALLRLLHERTREAAANGHDTTALHAARAVAAVESAKRFVRQNVNPQLISARLMADLASLGVVTDLSHLDAEGRARMVDVSGKTPSAREARAEGEIAMSLETLKAIEMHALAKGDVLTVAQLAGVMAAKRTSELIPLCHPIPLTDVRVMLRPDPNIPGVKAESIVRTIAQTGVEMEALTAVSVALLTVYDMAKSADKGMTIRGVQLVSKTGGSRGDYLRAE